MLKFLFWCLLGINALLFAYGKGYLGHFSGEEHEPGRITNQLNVGKMVIVSAANPGTEAPAAEVAAAQAAAPAAAPATVPVASATPAPAPPASAPAPAPAAPAAALVCTDIGAFPAADARRFETRLAALGLGDRLSRRNAPSQEVSSYIVYLPPQGNKEGAERKTAELEQLGITNYFVISENSPLRWAVSLGVFKTENAAQTLLATLVKQGVHTARVSPRYANSKQLTFQLRDLDAATKKRVDAIAADFPTQEMHACK